jgi:hypothetical protein
MVGTPRRVLITSLAGGVDVHPDLHLDAEGVGSYIHS